MAMRANKPDKGSFDYEVSKNFFDVFSNDFPQSNVGRMVIQNQNYIPFKLVWLFLGRQGLNRKLAREIVFHWVRMGWIGLIKYHGITLKKRHYERRAS